MDAYISKPVKPEALLDILAQVISEVGQSARDNQPNATREEGDGDRAITRGASAPIDQKIESAPALQTAAQEHPVRPS